MEVDVIVDFLQVNQPQARGKGPKCTPIHLPGFIRCLLSPFGKWPYVKSFKMWGTKAQLCS